ncbi:MAG: hypothetical protein DMG58_29735 [Acidobacteria bacterium]|nr:MAG: hypothetical protein DMG58_29735 [Acidobacteriota bacterium]
MVGFHPARGFARSRARNRSACRRDHRAVPQVILRAVEQAGGNYTEAAKLLGVHPNYLHRLIRNMNLKSVLKGAG